LLLDCECADEIVEKLMQNRGNHA